MYLTWVVLRRSVRDFWAEVRVPVHWSWVGTDLGAGRLPRSDVFLALPLVSESVITLAWNVIIASDTRGLLPHNSNNSSLCITVHYKYSGIINRTDSGITLTCNIFQVSKLVGVHAYLISEWYPSIRLGMIVWLYDRTAQSKHYSFCKQDRDVTVVWSRHRYHYRPTYGYQLWVS